MNASDIPPEPHQERDATTIDFGHYRDMLENISDIAQLLNEFEIPERESRTYVLPLPTLNYSTCPESVRDYLNVDETSSLEVTTVKEFINHPDSSDPITDEIGYTVSFSIHSPGQTIFASRDFSRKVIDNDTFTKEKAGIDSPDNIFIVGSQEIIEIPRIRIADLQKFVLLGFGFAPEQLLGIDLDCENMFLFENQTNFENSLDDMAIGRRTTKAYDIGGIHVTLEFLDGQVQTFTITSDDPRQTTHVDLQKGLEISFRVPNDFAPDESDLIKFKEAMSLLVEKINRRRPSVTSASSGTITRILDEHPGAAMI